MSHERQAAIVANERFVAAPELVIEIISPGESNERRDRTSKLHIYGRFGVAEYWLVDPARQTVKQYGLAESTLELRGAATVGEELGSDVLPGFVCRVADIWR